MNEPYHRRADDRPRKDDGLIRLAKKVSIVGSAVIVSGTILAWFWIVLMSFTLRPYADQLEHITSRLDRLSMTDTMVVHRIEAMEHNREVDSRALADALAHPLFSDERTKALDRVKKK